ncbi:MAG: hypothetical protein WA705_07400 [Candidatus Ozemobacteraceae bacterium]
MAAVVSQELTGGGSHFWAADTDPAARKPIGGISTMSNGSGNESHGWEQAHRAFQAEDLSNVAEVGKTNVGNPVPRISRKK